MSTVLTQPRVTLTGGRLQLRGTQFEDRDKIKRLPGYVRYNGQQRAWEFYATAEALQGIRSLYPH